MQVWIRSFTEEELNTRWKNTAAEHLGITFTALGDTWLEATMPVDHRTKQPAGLLHGGCSVLLIESLGSMGSNLIIDTTQYIGMGMEVNANHLKPVSNGLVRGRATLIRKGKSSHVWTADLYNEANQLICTGRLTVAVVALKRT